MSTNKTEKENYLAEIPELPELPDLPDTLDIGMPPPSIDDIIAPAAPVVDSIVKPAPVQPKVDIAPPPPPPPPDYGNTQETQSTPPEIVTQLVESTVKAPDVMQHGVASGGNTSAQQTPAVGVTQEKSEVRKEIEKLLSEGLTDIYQTMTPQEQAIFRKKSEETAQAIEELVSGFRATARKIVDIIRSWLKNIPGINIFFLEQESKLKTDEILKLQRSLKKKERLKKLNIH